MRFPVFLSGVIIMALEIAVGRVLTPFYGDGVTVWGAIIGVLLCALATGYYVGGYFADKTYVKKNIVHIFAVFFLVSGCFILCVPFLVKIFSSQHILLTSFLLLPLPIVLLGMVSPLVLTQSTRTLKKLGMNAGTVYALGTLGSIVGTFGTVFVLFQFFTIQEIFVLLGVLCAGSALLLRTPLRYGGVLLLLICFFVYPSHAVIPEEGVDKTFPSTYGEIRVKDLAGTRHVSINGGHMSEINMSNRIQRLPYWDYLYCMEAPFLLDRFEEPSVLAIGLGAGYLPTNLVARYDAQIHAVEINPVMVKVAKEYFGYSLPVEVGDGRMFLANSDEEFDVIIVDAMHYFNYSYKVPRQLSSQEFFALAKNHIREDGFFVTHVLEEPKDEFFIDVLTTLKQEFSYVATYDCDSSIVMVAHQRPFVVPELDQYVFTTNATGRVFTDDFFPTI